MDLQLLREASESGDLTALTALLSDDKDINARLTGNETPLIRAAANGHLRTVQFLLSKGADVNASREDGMTALMRAAFIGNEDVVSTLLQHGADVNAKDRFGSTATQWALSRGHIGIVGLLKNGATANPATNAAFEKGLALVEEHHAHVAPYTHDVREQALQPTDIVVEVERDMQQSVSRGADVRKHDAHAAEQPPRNRSRVLVPALAIFVFSAVGAFALTKYLRQPKAIEKPAAAAAGLRQDENARPVETLALPVSSSVESEAEARKLSQSETADDFLEAPSATESRVENVRERIPPQDNIAVTQEPKGKMKRSAKILQSADPVTIPSGGDAMVVQEAKKEDDNRKAPDKDKNAEPQQQSGNSPRQTQTTNTSTTRPASEVSPQPTPNTTKRKVIQWP